MVGLQFHPESILTDVGYELLAAFLRLPGIGVAGSLPGIASERTRADRCRAALPSAPVTF